MNHSTLCLAGWVQPHDALAPIAPDAHHLDYADAGSEEAALALLAKHQHITTAIGWSLGGWLLMRAISEGLLPNCQRLVILSSPVQFVRSEDFPHAMPEETFTQFYNNFHSDPLRTARRFSHLVAKGDKHYMEVINALPAFTEAFTLQRWAWGLDVLQAMRYHQIDYARLPASITLVYGLQDTIVSPEQGKFLHSQLPEATAHFLADCAHAPHLHLQESLLELLQGAYA